MLNLIRHKLVPSGDTNRTNSTMKMLPNKIDLNFVTCNREIKPLNVVQQIVKSTFHL